MSRATASVAEHPPGLAFEIRIHVLLIDAELGHLLPLADALRRAGLAATIATSGDEALFEVEVSPPDVVILDAEIADRSLLSRLRKLTSTLPVVLMSSAGPTQPHIAAMLSDVDVGYAAYIEKPVEARLLLDLLRAQAARAMRQPLPALAKLLADRGVGRATEPCVSRFKARHLR